MKQKFTILAAAILMMATITNATVWRVSNRVINGITVNADFHTLQDAINGASAGDTLYLMGSKNNYGNGTFNKPLVVIGPGYWLGNNANTQAVTDTARVERLTFNAGSERSVIQGLYLYYSDIFNFNLITINVDSISIKKNYIYPIINDYNNYNGYGIRLTGNRSNITICQNWINARVHSDDYGEDIFCISFDGIPTNCIISNNFIRAYKSYSNGTCRSIYMAVEDVANDLKIYNNVIWGNYTTYYTEQLNNIFVSGTKSGGGDLMMHNLCNATQYPIDPPGLNNQQNVDMSTVFVDYEKYIDNGYELATGSPAIGAGVNGGDCGVFSFDTGGYPYVLSGMPAIPAIYEATVQPMGETSVPVTIKAVSHNEHK